jgi:PhnB protein
LTTSFAPQLYINHGEKDISFYKKAFGAVEQLCFTNDDGSIHVAELLIGDAMFHLHEITSDKSLVSPLHSGVTTVLIGLFVSDVDAVMKSAEESGAIIVSPAKDYEYGYRQGRIIDPFGHHWMIESKI